ncbi:MAG: hypothetical protein COA83_11640 [Methylophaga sp.]|nr:MAG: hypothetical protein COA83_11640 [Methylophaga sp.]
MEFEQKILAAKEKRHSHFIKVAMVLVIISLLCALVIILLSYSAASNDSDKGVEAVKQKEVLSAPVSSSEIPDEQLRKTYIKALSHYQNILKAELNKIDLIKWNKARYEQLSSLRDKGLTEFSAGDYVSAISSIEQLTQLSQTTIAESQQQFEHALSNAHNSYNADQYDDAKLQIGQALMLDNTSIKAADLSVNIDKLPEIIDQLAKINTAKIENKLDTELKLIKQLLKLAPNRTEAVKRKQVLTQAINQRNFNSYISQAHKALKQQDTETAKKKIISAKKIFPNRQEVADVTLALQDLESKQRFKMHQEKAQLAMSSDDWPTAKKQLELTLHEQADDSASQKYLTQATKIIAFNTEFEQHIKSPYRLSNKNLASKLENKIELASVFSDLSSSLSKNSNTLSRLIKDMNREVSVEISSDNLTTISVRSVGIVGKTQSKTIKLLPGEYTFEGKRKGFKSKLISVLIPYDKPHFQISIYCDEPI